MLVATGFATHTRLTRGRHDGHSLARLSRYVQEEYDMNSKSSDQWKFVRASGSTIAAVSY